MTASSIYSNDDQAYYGRLNGTRGYGWCARSNDSNPWLQIDLGKEFEVCGVATQGGTSSSEWTTHFKLSFSSDGNIWTFYQDDYGNEVVRFHFICDNSVRRVRENWEYYTFFPSGMKDKL